MFWCRTSTQRNKNEATANVLYTHDYFIAFVMQAVFQSEIGTLLEQVGTGKESLSFMKRRIRRMAAQWASAARRLDDKLRAHWREQKRVNCEALWRTLEDESVGERTRERARVVVSCFQSVVAATDCRRGACKCFAPFLNRFLVFFFCKSGNIFLIS